MDALINTARRPGALPQMMSQPMNMQPQGSSVLNPISNQQQQQAPWVSTSAGVPPRPATPNGLQILQGANLLWDQTYDLNSVEIRSQDRM